MALGSAMRVLPMGPLAVLVEHPPGGPARFADAIRSRHWSGVVDVVPAERTVLVRCDAPERLAVVADRLTGLRPHDAESGLRRHVTIPVVYDGEDLDAVAAGLGLTTDEVAELHHRAEYEVAFCGFAPGFGYLTGLPPQLHLPRRPTPRMRVPAGSVAIAAGYTAVYPSGSPGGWHLIGRTDVVVFDPHRSAPSLLHPGTLVRFEPA